MRNVVRRSGAGAGSGNLPVNVIAPVPATDRSIFFCGHLRRKGYRANHRDLAIKNRHECFGCHGSIRCALSFSDRNSFGIAGLVMLHAGMSRRLQHQSFGCTV